MKRNEERWKVVMKKRRKNELWKDGREEGRNELINEAINE